MIATQSIATVLAALLFSLVVPLFGYVYLGPLYSLLFLTGYLGGFMLWQLLPVTPTGDPFVYLTG